MNKLLVLIGSCLIIFGLSAEVIAQTLQSNNYQITESFIGPGGTVNSSSSHYSESSSVGDIGIGTSGSTSYQTESGFNTTSDPRLSVIINTSSVAFGSLSTAVASTGTSTFSVLNYTAHGYSVYTLGSPPSNGTHALSALNPGTTSSTGTEQYGINVTGPNNVGAGNFGAAPVQVPSGSFSYGTASTNYDTANTFRYVAGEKIAQSVQTSGETDFTISYLINVSNTTPGGTYVGSQSLVVVGNY